MVRACGSSESRQTTKDNLLYGKVGGVRRVGRGLLQEVVADLGKLAIRNWKRLAGGRNECR